VGVGGFGEGVAQAVVEGVVDQGQEFLDCFGEFDELGDAAALGPGQPAGEQCPAVGAFGGKDLAELFFERVGV
jgi:hypothetical protein